MAQITLSNCSCKSDSDCCCGGGSGQSLCIASSVCSSVSTGSATVTIPANSCITKIYASMPNASNNAKYIRVQITGATSIFCYALPSVPSSGVTFDTNLIQPLCVGNIAATGTVTAFNETNGTLNEILTLTVVYCPNCC